MRAIVIDLMGIPTKFRPTGSYRRLRSFAAAGKDQRKIATAVARELRGFIWAIGTRAETVAKQRAAA
jgi:hypothetical protein